MNTKKISQTIKDFVQEQYGQDEANNPSWDIEALAKRIAGTDYTPVIFRKFKDGEVIALFPALAGDGDISTCCSYMHIGQHGSASIDLGKRIPLASRKEYLPLKKELEGKGYNLKVITKFSSQHHALRRAELDRHNPQ